MVSANFIMLPLLISNKNNNNLSGIAISMIGFILNSYWISKIKSFRYLNSIKFELLFDIEKELSYDFFNKEYEKIKKHPKHKSFTSIDKTYARVLQILFIIAFIIQLSTIIK